MAQDTEHDLLNDWRIGVAGGPILAFVGLAGYFNTAPVDLFLPEMVYIAMGVLAFGLGIWKFNRGDHYIDA